MQSFLLLIYTIGHQKRGTKVYEICHFKTHLELTLVLLSDTEKLFIYFSIFSF